MTREAEAGAFEVARSDARDAQDTLELFRDAGVDGAPLEEAERQVMATASRFAAADRALQAEF